MKTTTLASLALLGLSCAQPHAPPPVAAPAAVAAAPVEPDEALPPLPADAPTPPPVDDARSLPLEVVGRHVDGAFETLEARTKVECLAWSISDVRVELPAGATQPWSGAASDGRLLVRRAAGAGQRVRVVSAPGGCDAKRAKVFHFELPAKIELPSDPKVRARWAEVLQRHVGDAHEWGAFAVERLRELYVEPAQATLAAPKGKDGNKKGAKAPARATVTPPRRAPSDLARLMDTTTGVMSLQETLQADRRLSFGNDEPATIPLAELKGPPIPTHPWAEMTAALGRAAPDEPLASAAPADFAFVRFRSLPAMFALLDRVEGVLRPAGGLVEGDGRRAALSERYEAELGIGRGGLARRFGPEAVVDLAAVGSDPYLREGSDVTLIFRVKSPTLFEAGLAAALAVHAAAHGALQTASVEHAGVTIRVTTSADGAVRQHRARVGAFELVGNSRGALERVIDAAAGKAPRLADEPDFRYALARDAAVPADALAFLSDRYVASVVGPRQKILEARRQLALAELQRPAFAALLHGFVYGRSPASADALVATGLLRADELAHGDGGAIAFSPGQAPRSAWGRPAALVPLADRAAPDKVTKSEAEAYRLFASGYESYWRTYLDPVALRVSTDPKGGDALSVDLRVLPIIDGTDYHHLAREVGEARLTAGGARRGAQMTLGLGADAELRRDLRATASDVPLVGHVDVDWLGGWAIAGIDDSMWGGGKIVPDVDVDHGMRETFRLLHELPVFGGVEVRKPAAAALFLAGAKAQLDKLAPGILRWSDGGKQRDVAFVKVTGGDAARELADGVDQISLYYAFCKNELVLSLSEKTLRRRIDDCLDGRVAKAAAAPTPGGAAEAQAVFAIDVRPDGPLARFALSHFKKEVVGGQRATARLAEIVLRGAPELDPRRAQALGRELFATELATPAGLPFTLGDDGLRGDATGRPGASTAILEGAAPTAAERAALDAFRRFRSDVSFDPEPATKGAPAARSLHVRLQLGGAP